ncbi:MAG: ATP-binding protein [Coriobacteriales bacterium]|jgi:ATP-dependent DNA helicase RecG|nr:ATP-binding protein [Coriobacteriales bacterium]
MKSPLVELKREINTDFNKEVIAFANTEGGVIFVGVDDDGTIIGVHDCDSIMQQIGSLIRQGIKPGLTAYTSIESIQENNCEIIKVNILRGGQKTISSCEQGYEIRWSVCQTWCLIGSRYR